MVVVALALSGLQVGQEGGSSLGWFLVEQYGCLQMKQRQLLR